MLKALTLQQPEPVTQDLALPILQLQTIKNLTLEHILLLKLRFQVGPQMAEYVITNRHREILF